jgi:YidC/Oxa1 family membrane protein insertase
VRPLFSSSSIFSDIGSIFHPLFWVFAQALAVFYSLIPNYIVAITLLTVLVMILTAPLTIKSTKSMMEMQRIQPEFKKLQTKYKGDREKLNEEVMKLYREHGVSPVGGCLPLLLQMPFFVCLYGVIKGLVNTKTINHIKYSEPRYLDHSTRMYKDIIHTNGKLESFGIDLSQTPFQHHGSIGQGLPYWIIFFAAIGLQYMQMARLNKRNAANIQNNPQMQTMQTMQKVTPLIFGVIYIAFPIGVTVYFIVSSFCRIVIQEILFRTGVTAPKPAGEAGARIAPAPPRRRGIMDRLADAQKDAQEARRRQMGSGSSIDASSKDASPPAGNGQKPKPKPSIHPSGSKPSGQGQGGNRPQQQRPAKAIGGSAKDGPTPDTNGHSSRASASGNGAVSNGKEVAGTPDGNGDAPANPEELPPQSKDKRPRKAR